MNKQKATFTSLIVLVHSSDDKLKGNFSELVLFTCYRHLFFGTGVKSAFWNNLGDVLTAVHSGALKVHYTGFSSVCHRETLNWEGLNADSINCVVGWGGLGLLLTAFSGVLVLVQFLNSLHFFSPSYYFFSLFSLFSFFLSVSAARGKFSFGKQNIKINMWKSRC